MNESSMAARLRSAGGEVGEEGESGREMEDSPGAGSALGAGGLALARLRMWPPRSEWGRWRRRSLGPVHMTTPCSMAVRSSRTLPGQR